MKEYPLAVAVSAVVRDNKILLIKRLKGDYVGLWGLPGGKIEKDEHLSEAAVREIFEESGIRTEFKNLLGVVSENLIENGNTTKHFLLHVCELAPQTSEIKNSSEGGLKWFALDEVEGMNDEIIPSDFLIIEKIIKGKEGNYYDCVIEKSGDNHLLRKFE